MHCNVEVYDNVNNIEFVFLEFWLDVSVLTISGKFKNYQKRIIFLCLIVSSKTKLIVFLSRFDRLFGRPGVWDFFCFSYQLFSFLFFLKCGARMDSILCTSNSAIDLLLLSLFNNVLTYPQAVVAHFINPNIQLLFTFFFLPFIFSDGFCDGNLVSTYKQAGTLLIFF